MNIHSISDRVLTFERRFEAPRDVVFALWTHPRHLIRWYGPRGHSLSQCELDFQEGGTWRFCMNRGDEDVWVWGSYREIVAPEKLVFSHSMDWHRYETLVTLHFDDLGDGTTLMRFRQAEFRTLEDCADHHWGWHSALDVLADYIIGLKGLGLLHPELYNQDRRDGVAEDYAAAAASAAEERRAEAESKKKVG